jgi:tetratricopeptide (TPR) repeat protein
MLQGVFRTKEGRRIAATFLLLVIITGVFIYNSVKVNHQYQEKTVMADKSLKEGNYEQAIEAYLSALSLKDSDREFLTIGLAEAYVGLTEFDQALKVLRDSYQKTPGIAIKEKIEDVTARKTDYEYLQIISRADIYFTNEEYDKAIIEYEKAKLIKSKEETSYRRIAESFMNKGDYNSAQKEAQEGLALTQNSELKSLLQEIEAYLKIEQYDIMVSDADEYIYQENYEDGIRKYQQAIKLLPKESQAYTGLAQTYLDLGEYKKAMVLLESALKNVQNDELYNLYDKAVAYVEEIEARASILNEIYEGVNQLDMQLLINLLNSDSYKDRIAPEIPIYYGAQGIGEKIVDGYGLVIYENEAIYSGQFSNEVRKGIGTYFMLTTQYGYGSFYYYHGVWSNGLPNGEGTTVEEIGYTDKEGKQHMKKTVTEGIYYNGVENGSMHKYLYLDGVETGNVEYTAHNGIPTPMKGDQRQTVPNLNGEPYDIGRLYLNGKSTGEYYKAVPGAIWGVKLFIK